MKRTLFCATVALASIAANASYLYWQVDDSSVIAYNETAPEGYTIGSDAYAMLKSDNSNASGYTTYGADGQVTDNKASIGSSYYSNIGTDAGYSYFVELYNNNGDLIARSQSINSSSGSDWTSGYAESLRTSDLASIPSVNVWHAGNFRAVPEPTSAILMLFGAAMLGLKRKNRSQC